jgi:hypothetical protein
MSQPLPKHILLIGLPSSGKTSFLAALWYLVQQPTSRLRLDHLEGDSKYLNQICKSWVDCVLVPHTRADSETLTSMILRDGQTDQTLTLEIPDLSGESFTLQWTTRQITKGYEEFLKRATGAILFVNPDKVVKPVRIDMADPLVDEIASAATQETVPADGNSSQGSSWSAENTPTQVQLVELLQQIADRDSFRAPFQVAVFVSAWDKLVSSGQTPSEWLHAQLPLLDQFMESNEDLFTFAVYGVSAQGAEYTESLIQELFDKVASDRTLVVGNNIVNAHDLTEPLQWLMR